MNSTTEKDPLDLLPPAGPVVLGRNALEVALVEVRFNPTVDAVGSSDGLTIGAAIREAGVDVPGQQPIDEQTVTVNVEPSGASHEIEKRVRGWQYTSTDQTLVIAVQPSLLSVQTTRYQRWSESLAPQLAAVCDAVAGVLTPQLVHRVGVRYINRFIDSGADSPRAWNGRIDSHLLGVVGHAQLGQRLTSAQQQFEVDLGGAQAAVVRHGAFRDGATRGSFNYLLDLDVFDNQATIFNSAGIRDRATDLNRAAMALFREMITEDYLRIQLDAQAVAEYDTEVGS